MLISLYIRQNIINKTVINKYANDIKNSRITFFSAIKVTTYLRITIQIISH